MEKIVVKTTLEEMFPLLRPDLKPDAVMCQREELSQATGLGSEAGMSGGGDR